MVLVKDFVHPIVNLASATTACVYVTDKAVGRRDSDISKADSSVIVPYFR